jgi:hypothetical protein
VKKRILVLHIRSHPEKLSQTIGKNKKLISLESFPSGDKLFGNEKEIKIETLELGPEQSDLLRWMIKTEEKFTIKYVEKKHETLRSLVSLNTIPSYTRPDHIFQITYKDTEIFDSEAKKYGVITGFHGSSLENWYSILYNSLQNYSHTKKMKNGAAFGDGVYFCEDISVAHDFLVPGTSWRHSNLGKKIGCVCVSDIIKHPTVTISRSNIGVSKDSKVTSIIFSFRVPTLLYQMQHTFVSSTS